MGHLNFLVIMDLQAIVARIDQLKEELDQLRPIRADYLNKLNQKIRLDWNYHSNSIEGNTLSMSETKSFILWGITAKGKPFRDYLEMKGHNEALTKLYQIVQQDLVITERLIKDFHRIILVEPYADKEAEINPGEWKKIPNYLYSPTNERIDFAAPEEVPQRMNSLINWLNNHLNPPKRKKKQYDLHPLLIAAGFHIQFIQIHPFGDGNGRMARILTNLILMSCGYVPAIVTLETRRAYYDAINVGSLENPQMLASYLGESIINTFELAIKAAKGETIEEEDDLDKELALLNQQLKGRGQEIKKVKSQETLKVFGYTILPLIAEQFLEVHRKFEQFYVSLDFSLIAYEYGEDFYAVHDEYEEIEWEADLVIYPLIPIKQLHFPIIPVLLEGFPVFLKCQFNNFNKPTKEFFSHEVELKISFEETHFKLHDTSGQVYSYLYTKEFSKEELTAIVKEDAKKHLEKIKELTNGN